MADSIPVRVRHPVPVVHKPPRARGFKLGVTPVETETRLIVAVPEGFHVVPESGWGGPAPLLSGPDGMPWTELVSYKDQKPHPIPVAKFVEWLQGRGDYGSDDGHAWDMDLSFSGTPFPMPREAPGVPAGSEVASDIEAAARAAALVYLEGNVRACGDRVLLRLRPLVQSSPVMRPGFVEPSLALTRSVERPFESVTPFSTFDRLTGDVESFYAPHKLEVEPCPVVDGFRAAFPGDPPGLLDVEEFALLLPMYVIDCLDHRERRSNRRAKVDISDEARGKLQGWAVRCQFGILPEEGLPDMLRQAASILDALAAANLNGDGYVQTRFADHIRGRILPRAAGAAIPAEDLSALDALPAS